MSELGAEARSLIESARGGDQPSAADRERMRGKLVAELGAAAFASAAVASTAASAGATSVPAGTSGTASSGLFGALKLALAALVVGAVGAGAVLGLRPEPVAKSRAVVPAAPAAPAAPQAEPVPAPVVTPLVGPAAPNVEEPASRPARARPRTVESKPAAPAPAPATGDANTLSEELALLSRAQTALRSGQAEQALQLVREHERRFAQGALVQERLGITALARCALGGDTSEVVSELSRAAPGSPMLERVREACAKK